MAWLPLSLAPPEALATVGQAVSTALSAFQTALQALKIQAQVAAALATDDTQPTVAAVNAAIQAAVTAINALLDEILDDAGAYMLVVPLPKKGFVPITTTPDNRTNLVVFPSSALNALDGATAEAVRNTSLFDQVTNPDNLFVGGNAHVVRTLAESLNDPGDANRPRFQRQDHWAYALIVAGAQDITTALTVAGFMDRTFGRRSAVPPSRGVVNLVPQGVTARISGRERRAVVEWEPVPASRLLESFDSATVVPVEFAIVKSNDFRQKTAQSVADLFPSANLTAGLTGRFGARVAAVVRYDGVTSRWIDPTELEENRDYFYQVAFKTRVEPPPGDTDVEPSEAEYGALSACAEVRRSRTADRPVVSKPPDWERTPSVAQLFPPVEGFVDRIKEQLAAFARGSQTYNERNSAYIAFLDREIARFARQVEEVTAYVQQLNGLMQAATAAAGVYSTVASGRGPVGAFLADVVQRLSDTGDDSRPPFDTGTEYTMAVVILAVGPDTTAIERALAFLTALFTPGGAPDPAFAGIEAVATAVAAAEQATIDRVLGPDANPTTGSTAFNTDMTPRPAGQGDADCD